MRVLYCHCAYAKVVPEDVKKDVLARLSGSGIAFDAVADLCELSARKDPALARLADGEVADIDHLLDLAQAFPQNFPAFHAHQSAQRVFQRPQLLAEKANEFTAPGRRHLSPTTESGLGPVHGRDHGGR